MALVVRTGAPAKKGAQRASSQESVGQSSTHSSLKQIPGHCRTRSSSSSSEGNSCINAFVFIDIVYSILVLYLDRRKPERLCYEGAVKFLSDGFPGRLAEARQKCGLSQNGLAQKAGLAQQTVRKLELGRAYPALDTLERLAHALGVTPCWLAFGDAGRKDA